MTAWSSEEDDQLDGQSALNRLFELQCRYSELYASYLAGQVSRTLDPNDKENTAWLDAEWKFIHYFTVGADALRVIVAALVGNLRDVPDSILDFPCGSGRVTRHLRAFFPASRLVACDLYDYHVRFCVDHLGAEGVVSKENFDEIDFAQQFDLIFCASLLTHLPEDLFYSALRLISRSLNDGGIAIVTLHGRHSEFIQKHRWKYLDDSLYGVIESTLGDTGFGYVDYDRDFRAKFDRQARYGLTLCRPHWTLQAVEEDYGIRVLGYTERGWDDHHDVLVIGKPGIND
jgi:SAM-dependent methyltransferase